MTDERDALVARWKAELAEARIGWICDEKSELWPPHDTHQGNCGHPHRYDGSCAICRAGDRPEALDALLRFLAESAIPDEEGVPGPATPLARARAWLHRLLPTGATCPLCGQNAKVYRRNLNSGMAVALLTMVAAEQSPGQWLHKPTVLRGVASSARDESLLRFWGLLEEQKELRPDGGRAGYWRVTEAGWRWAHGKIEVPKYVDVYNGQARGVPYGPLVSIDDALGEGFDRRELLAAAGRAV